MMDMGCLICPFLPFVRPSRMHCWTSPALETPVRTIEIRMSHVYASISMYLHMNSLSAKAMVVTWAYESTAHWAGHQAGPGTAVPLCLQHAPHGIPGCNTGGQPSQVLP